MRFKLNLAALHPHVVIPINYQYPLSAAIYKIIDRADEAYAEFLHKTGYRKEGSSKSFKLFTFSDIGTPFKIEGDRFRLLTSHAELQVCFHLPQTAETFIKGLFMHQQMDIADKKSRARFEVQSVQGLADPLREYKEQEIINRSLQPLSPVVVGLPNERGNYDFLAPDDPRFAESLLYNWRSKIAACFDEVTASDALLLAAIVSAQQTPKSRLITIKAGTSEQTKIRGWMNFELNVTGERRFINLLLNAGMGVYNSFGCGCVA